MTARLVGFVGRIGAGKTTAAQQLATGFGFHRMRFAQPLKDMMKALGLNEREYDGDLKEAPCDLLCGRTPRHAMQTIGTEWGRDMIAKNLWVQNWRIRAQRLLDAGESVCVDDVRFENEVETIRDMGGVLVRIDRPGAVVNAHASERPEMLLVDHVVLNDGNQNDLYRNVKIVLGLNVEAAFDRAISEAS